MDARSGAHCRYGVPYRTVEVHPLFKSELAFSDYKKVPILVSPAGEEMHESNAIIEAISERAAVPAAAAAPPRRRGCVQCV